MTDPGLRPTIGYRHLWRDDKGVSRQQRCELTAFDLKGVGRLTPSGGQPRVETVSTVGLAANARVLIDALHDADRWLDELLSDPLQTLELLALREGRTDRSIRMTLSLAVPRPRHRQGRSRGTPATWLRFEACR